MTPTAELSTISEPLRHSPLSVHGVVLFPAPAGSLVQVDAGEYVAWLQSQVTTLRSQLALCRASLSPELQRAIDTLQIGTGATANDSYNFKTNSTITSTTTAATTETENSPPQPLSQPKSKLPRPHTQPTLKRPQPSAFIPITAAPNADTLPPPQRPPVFRPLSDDITNGGSRRVHPLLRRIFDRTSSATRVFPDEQSDLTTCNNVNNGGSGRLLRPRRRRSISLDNFGRTISPVPGDAAAASRRSFVVEAAIVAAPVAIRTQSGSSALFKVARARAQSAVAELQVENESESDDEPISIDPALAAAASNGPQDFLADGSLDTISEQELSEYSGKLRALSDGAALNRRSKQSPERHPNHPNDRDREHPDRALGLPSTSVPAPAPASPFPTSSASASVDSTDRTAAAEALARRTANVTNGNAGAGGEVRLRRSFSYDAKAHSQYRASTHMEDVTNRKSITKRRDSILGPRRAGAGGGAGIREAGTTFRRWMRFGNDDDALRRTASQTMNAPHRMEPRASMSSKASWRESGDSTLNSSATARRPKLASLFRRKHTFHQL